jgi:hypothetical protein
MLRHAVRAAPCYITYENEPDDAFVEDFTARKGQHWKEIRGPIDAYIGQQVLKHIDEALSHRRRRRAQHVHIYAARLQRLIDGEINRGLAIIAYNDTFEVHHGSGYQIVECDAFEGAISRLIAGIRPLSRKELRRKRIQSRHWADSCAFAISQAFFGKTLPA